MQETFADCLVSTQMASFERRWLEQFVRLARQGPRPALAGVCAVMPAPTNQDSWTSPSLIAYSTSEPGQTSTGSSAAISNAVATTEAPRPK